MGEKLILIVDDDSRNIFALSAVLKAKGFKTVSAGTMKDAFRIIDETKSVGMVLMDMMMPGMDGYEAMTYMKKQEKYSLIPVIAVTAQAMPGDRQKCLNAGADEYLPKPVDIDVLLSIIKRFVNTGYD
jgi:CheY-like chemotaxis protein